MKSVVLISLDPELIADTRDACKERRLQLHVDSEWLRAIEKSAHADLMIVDLLATLNPPHRISGYVKFAEAKMKSAAVQTPIVLIGPPVGYRLNGMVGWPGFLTAFVERPIDDGRLQYLLDFV